MNRRGASKAPGADTYAAQEAAERAGAARADAPGAKVLADIFFCGSEEVIEI